MELPPYAVVPVTFAPGSAVSAEVDIGPYQAFAIHVPSGWQGTAGTFTGTSPVTNGSQPSGVSQLLISGTAFSGIIQPGDKFVVAAQTFYATASVTPTATNVTVQVYPAIGATIATGQAITYTGATAISSVGFQASPWNSQDQALGPAGPTGSDRQPAYFKVFNDGGTEITVKVSSSQISALATAGLAQALIPFRNLKLVSNSNTSPIAQNIPLTVLLLCKTYGGS